jgi:hypothetical protein
MCQRLTVPTCDSVCPSSCQASDVEVSNPDRASRANGWNSLLPPYRQTSPRLTVTRSASSRSFVLLFSSRVAITFASVAAIQL